MKGHRRRSDVVYDNRLITFTAPAICVFRRCEVGKKPLRRMRTDGCVCDLCAKAADIGQVEYDGAAEFHGSVVRDKFNFDADNLAVSILPEVADIAAIAEAADGNDTKGQYASTHIGKRNSAAVVVPSVLFFIITESSSDVLFMSVEMREIN